jgi:hypothetical protein
MARLRFAVLRRVAVVLMRVDRMQIFRSQSAMTRRFTQLHGCRRVSAQRQGENDQRNQEEMYGLTHGGKYRPVFRAGRVSLINVEPSRTYLVLGV